MYVVEEKIMRHENRRNIAQVVVWGPFHTEGEAKKYAEHLRRGLVTVYQVSKPPNV